jgi:hypothetical protein
MARRSPTQSFARSPGTRKATLSACVEPPREKGRDRRGGSDVARHSAGASLAHGAEVTTLLDPRAGPLPSGVGATSPSRTRPPWAARQHQHGRQLWRPLCLNQGMTAVWGRPEPCSAGLRSGGTPPRRGTKEGFLRHDFLQLEFGGARLDLFCIGVLPKTVRK